MIVIPYAVYDEAELASYATPTERAELEAMLERHTDEEVAQLAAMLR